MSILKVRIAKAGQTIEVDPESITDDRIFAEIITAGLEALLNGGMTKVGAVTKMEGEEKVKAQAAAMEIATKRLAKLQSGETLVRGKKSDTKLPAAIRNEGMRLARMVLKDQARAAGIIPSRVEAKVWTEGAKAYLESDDGKILILQAEDNLKNKPVKVEEPADDKAKAALTAKLAALGVHTSKKLEAAAEAKKAERKGSLSAKQAGKVAPRKAQPQPEHRVH